MHWDFCSGKVVALVSLHVPITSQRHGEIGTKCVKNDVSKAKTQKKNCESNIKDVNL